MTIQKNNVVAINYNLQGDDGNVIDSTQGGQPLEYIHGNNFLLPKLEEQLEGKQQGDSFSAVLSPADGYGEYDETLLVELPREDFETDMPVEVGMQFQAMTSTGPQIVKIAKISGDTITVDANHELAGQTLHFEVQVVSVREATQEELDAQMAGGGCGCGGCGDRCGGDCSDSCSCGGGCCG